MLKENKMYTEFKPKHIWRSTLFFLLTVCLPSGSATTAEVSLERPLEKIITAYSSVSANMAPLWITQERGFFRKNGLDVQLVFIESGSTTVQSLISNEVAFAQMAGAGVLQSRLRGSDVVLMGEQTLPVSDLSPVYSPQGATATSISDIK